MSSSIAIGIDLGGTRIKGVALDAESNLLHQLYTPTNDGDEDVWKKAVYNTVEELLRITSVFFIIGFPRGY
jgi:glucokinase